MRQTPFLALPNGTRVSLSKVFEIKVMRRPSLLPTVTKITTRAKTFTIYGDLSDSINKAQLGAYGFLASIEGRHWLNLLNAVHVAVKVCKNDSSEFNVQASYEYFRARKKSRIRIGIKQLEALKHRSIPLVCS